MVSIQATGLKAAILELGIKKVAVPKMMNNVVEEVSKAFIQEVKDHVKQQDYSFPTLSAKYRMRKRRNRDKWWIHEGSFLDKLSYVVKSGSRATAGALPSVTYNETISLELLALTLEMGSPEHNIPARPLFRNAKRDFDTSGHMKAAIDKVISKYMGV